MSGSDRIPPRFVTTLTEVVEPDVAEKTEPDPRVMSAEASVPEADPPALNQEAMTVQAEEVLHAVMRRVDRLLEQRLQQTIASVVQEQMRLAVPRLREEIELAVRQSVYEAVVDGLAPGEGAAVNGTPRK